MNTPSLQVLEHDPSVALLTTVLDTLPVGVTVLDEELRIAQINMALATLLGYPTTDLAGERLRAHWPELATALTPYCTQVLTSGLPVVAQVLAATPRNAPDRRRWQINLYPLVLPDTETPQLCLIIHDMTVQRCGNATSEANAQRLRLALDATQLSAWEWDIGADTVTYAAPQSTYVTLSPDHLTRTVAELRAIVYPPDLPAYDQSRARAIASTGPYQYQVRVQAPDGQLRWLDVRGLVQRDALGHPVRAFGVTRDISDEKHREAIQSFHNAISQALSPTLDVDATLQALVRLPLPTLADACAIYLLADGMVQPAAAATGDPPLTLLPSPLACDSETSLVSHVLRTGVAQLRNEVALAEVPPITSQPAHAALLVPLMTEGRILGVIQLELTTTARCYTANDLALAEGLARRGAEAVLRAQCMARTRAAQQAAAETLARLEALVCSAPNGICYLDRDLRFQMVNPALAAINQRSPADHLGRTMTEVCPVMAAWIEPMLHQVLATGVAMRELELPTSSRLTDARAHNWQISIYPVGGATGEITGLGVMVTDITERRRAEWALRDTERKLGTLFDILPVGISILDRNCNVVYMNPAHEQILHIEHSNQFQAAHQTFTYLRPDGTPMPITELAGVRAFVEQHAVLNVETGIRTERGDAIWIDVSAVPVDFPDWSMVTVKLDITARMQAEIALRESELRYRTLFETMAQGVVYQDSTGQITAANPAAERILGMSLAQMQGRTSIDLRWQAIHADGTPFAGETHPSMVALQTGQVVHGVIMGIYNPTADAYRWIRIHAVPQFAPGMATPPQVFTTFDDITERQQMLQALEYERAQLSAVISTMYEGVIAFRPDGTVALCNTAALRLMGLNQPHATLSTLDQAAQLLTYDVNGHLLAPADWPTNRVLRGESFNALDLRVRPTAQTTERWFALNGSPVYDDHGTRILGVITFQDISQRKADEAALLSASAQAEMHAQVALKHASRLNSLLTHAPIGIALLDTDLRVQHINPYLATLNGYPADRQLGYTLSEVVPILASKIDRYFLEVLATGEPLLDIELVGSPQATPNQPRTWRTSYFPVRTGTGEILGVGTLVIDITAQRQLEQNLQLEHQQLETILQTLDAGVMAFTPAGTVAVMNHAAQQHLRVAPTMQQPTRLEVLHASPVQWYDAEGGRLPLTQMPSARVLRGERFRNLELCLRGATADAVRWMSFSGAPIFAADGTLVLGVVSGSDITQRKQDALALEAYAAELRDTNEALTRALHLKDEFLTMMSHELRTPLNGILGLTEAMVEAIYGPISERQHTALAKITQSGHHLLTIISDILDLSALAADKVVLDFQPIVVQSLCRSALQSVRTTAQQKEIDLQCQNVDTAVRLAADPRRLTQILSNLLDNAVKFTPKGGTVGLEVTADRAQAHIEFAVWDTGIGIDEADYPRLFQPFTQIDGQLSRSHGGIGLGLTLVRRLVELHGGSIRLESTPGHGSRFTISLPWSNEAMVKAATAHY